MNGNNEAFVSVTGIYSLAKDDVCEAVLREKNLSFIRLYSDKAAVFPDDIVLTEENILGNLAKGCNCDVFFIQSSRRIVKLYNVLSSDNTLFVTGHCNSSCLMCPSSDYSRKNGERYSERELRELVRHYPDRLGHLTITGGEPFLLGRNIFPVLSDLKSRFPHDEFLLLTNGRIFANNEFCNMLQCSIPEKTLIGIPVHGHNAEIHDMITQTAGSFWQTFLGLKHLLLRGINIEIRIVVSGLNVSDIDNIADLIVKEFPAVNVVRVMGLEMLGSAAVNKDFVWIPYRKAFEASKSAVRKLILHGIDTSFYNFPLCSVDKEYRMLCSQSISDYKIRYPDACDECILKDACGGIFGGSFRFAKDDVIPVKA